MKTQVEGHTFTRGDFLRGGGGLLFTAGVLGVAGCGGESSSGSAGSEQVTLQFGHNAPADSPTGKAAQRLAELASKKTDGGLTIEVFPSNQLGENTELIEQTSSGATAMVMEGLGTLGPLVQEYNLMQVPFLFRSQEHIHEVVEGEIGTELANLVQEQTGIMLLSQTWDRLPRQTTGNKRMARPDAFNNFLLRTGSVGSTEAFKMFGAEPSSIPLDDIYVALQQGTVEGVDLPTDYVANLSLDEVNSHINMLNHTYGTQFVGINADRFGNLPENYQTALREAIGEAGERNNRLTEEAEDKYVDELRAGGMTIAQVSDDQRQEFVEIVRQNLGQLESNWEGTAGLGEEILSVGRG